MENLFEKELLGKHDGENYSMAGWCIAGALFGIFAIPFIWLISIQCNGVGYKTLDTNLERAAYFQGYSKVVKRKRFTALVIGWLLWFAFLLFVFVINALMLAA